jgi:hypothetical protein
VLGPERSDAIPPAHPLEYQRNYCEESQEGVNAEPRIGHRRRCHHDSRGNVDQQVHGDESHHDHDDDESGS